MLIATKHKLKKNETLFHVSAIPKLKMLKYKSYLGIYIDNTLSWTHLFSHIRKNVNSKIALLKRVSYYLTYEMKVNLFYNAYVKSIINYCCPIWGKAKNNANPIRKISKANSWNYFKQINKKNR